MARIQAYRAFDIREVIRPGGSLSLDDDRIIIRHGEWRSSFTGDFHAVPTGVVGDLRGISRTVGGKPVFEAEVDRSGFTAFDILALRDNDRFFAYVLSGADRLDGSTGSDYLIGFGGNDRLLGGAGGDELFGGSDRDKVYGGAGDDFLAGGGGIDLLDGGADNDTFLVDQSGDTVVEGSGGGYDTMLCSVSASIVANVEKLVLTGRDRLTAHGDPNADELHGNGADNRLFGDGGADRLFGSGGADMLDGGAGRDRLTGGGGSDTFRFLTAAEADGDHLLDFRSGTDCINLRAIDADSTATGEQAFVFVGLAAFSGHPGELRAGPGWLRGDLDGDGWADFGIALSGIEAGPEDLLL